MIPVSEHIITQAARAALGRTEGTATTTAELARIWPELSVDARSEIIADIIIAAPRLAGIERERWRHLITLGIGDPK